MSERESGPVYILARTVLTQQTTATPIVDPVLACPRSLDRALPWKSIPPLAAHLTPAASKPNLPPRTRSRPRALPVRPRLPSQAPRSTRARPPCARGWRARTRGSTPVSLRLGWGRGTPHPCACCGSPSRQHPHFKGNAVGTRGVLGASKKRP